jgi:hypothetical protein
MTSFHCYVTAKTSLCLGDKQDQYSFFYFRIFLPDPNLHRIVKAQIYISLELAFNRIVQNYENFCFRI